MKIAVVGGAGKMGKWIARLMLAENMEVVLIDSDAEKLSRASVELKTAGTTAMEAVREADVIIVSVPIGNFEQSVKELSVYFKDVQTVVDVTSVKEMPVAVMHKYLPGCVVLGAHPVFGPGASGLGGHNVVLTPTAAAEQALAEKAKSWLETRGARVEVMTPAEHDRRMAVVLGLAHFIAIVSGDTLLGLDNLGDFELTSGVTFRVLMTLVASVLNEDPSLYSSIQTHLPPLPALEKEFIHRASQWAELVEQKDGEEIKKRLSELQDKLQQKATDTSGAYNDMYRIARGK